MAANLKEELKSSSWLVRWASERGTAEQKHASFAGHRSIPGLQVHPVSWPPREVRLWVEAGGLYEPRAELEASRRGTKSLKSE